MCITSYIMTSKSDVWTGYGRELYMSKKENPEVKQVHRRNGVY